MVEAQPKKIGRYEILNELGRGGFGRVYRAYDPTVGRPAAIKVLTQVSEDTRTRFRNEAMVAGNLGHRNIVTVYEYGTHEDFPFLAMEYLEGRDLHQIIASHDPLSILDKCNIMSQVAEGLYCAHQSGVVHRDMKPANIMVLRDGAVKIMDFGIARLTQRPDATRLTQQGFLIGTLRYMAPEQFAGADFDVLCDIFAYGVIFHELLAYRHPFEAPDAQSLMYRLTFDEPSPLGELAPAVPDALQQVIARIMQKDRLRRYQSLKEVQFDLEPIRLDLQRGRAAGLLRDARELFDKQQYDASQKLVHEILSLEPSNRAGRKLWEDLQQQFQRRTVQPRIDASLRDAEELLAKRQFADAVEAFESALALDRDNAYIQGRIEKTRSLLELASKASRLLAEARRELEHQNLTAAYRIVSEALRHDPKNPEAAEFLKTIQAYAERLQAEQRVNEAIRKAQALVLIPAYDDAIAALNALGPDAESPRIREFVERVRSEKTAYERKQKLRSEMAKSTDLLREHRFEEAAACLEKLQAEFPEDQDIAHLLSYARKEQSALARAHAVESVTREARARADSQDFKGALAMLDQALKEYPGEGVLLRLLGSTLTAKAAWERQQAIQAICARCESLRTQQRFAEAVQSLEAALQDYSGDAALLGLLKQIKAERAEQRRREAVRKITSQAEKLMAEMRHQAALQLIQKALLDYPGDSRLAELDNRVREELRAREKARAVAAIGKEAGLLATARDFDEAVQVLDQGLESWPDDPDLLRWRAATLDQKKAWDQEVERAAAIEKQGQEARIVAATGDLDGALSLLDDALRRWPDATSLQAIREATLAEREHRAQHLRALQDLATLKRLALHVSGSAEASELLARALGIAAQHSGDEEIQSAAAEPVDLLSDIGRARQEIMEGNFQAALAICERRLSDYPGHPAFAEFKSEAGRAQRRASVEEAHRYAAAEPDLEKRAGILQAALEQHPDEAAIADELRLTRNKLALIDSIVEQARACEQSGRWEEALEKWNGLLTIYSRYPGLDATIERVRQACEKAASEAVEKGAHQIEQAIQAGDPAMAAELLRQAQAEYSGEPRFEELGRRVQEITENKKHARELFAKAQAASENGNHDECQTCLRQAFLLDETDAAFRNIVLNSLIDHAQVAMHTDWRQAEALVTEASSLQPGYTAPAAVLRAIADRRSIAADPPKAAAVQQTFEEPASSPPKRTRIPVLVAGSALAAILAGVAIWRALRGPGEIAVNIGANVSGASISVGDKHCATPHCALKLAPGTYTVRAAAGGYQAVTRQLTIAPQQSPADFKLALEPLPEILQVNTNFDSGQVYLDGRLHGELRDGQYSLSGIAPGRHTIRVTGTGADFQAEWRSAVAAPPALLQLTSGQDLAATVVANAGAAGSLICNCTPDRITVDGAPAAKSPASPGSPVALHDLKPGARQIALGSRSLVVDIGASPAVNVFLALDRNMGTLIVQTGEDKVKVFLNNHLYRRTTERGMLRIPTAVGEYSVRVEKDGFLSPQPRILVLKKGEEKPLLFTLKPARADLEIAGAVPGAQVRVDGQAVGETDRNGTFRHEVVPGSHTIELSKDDYAPVQVAEQFRAGSTLQLDRARIAMTRKPQPAVLPDPRQVEAQEWARIGGSTNPDDFDAFIRNHPGGSHSDQARNRADELRRQLRANAAREQEQAAWDRVDQNNKGQLQDYLSRFPAGSHAQEARAKSTEIERQAAQLLAAQRLREQKDREQADLAADEQAILKVLKDFEDAYNRKDITSLQGLWGGVPVAAYRQQFKDASDLHFQLQAAGQPAVNGKSAAAVCTRTLTYKGRSGGSQTHSERVKVMLARTAAGWSIRAIESN